MSLLSSRASRAVLAFTIVALGACADQQSATEVPPHGRASLSVGDVFVVTNTSGGNVAGSLRSLVSQATGGEVIHFDPSLAGKTITLDTTLEVLTRVTIEGPADKGITISGGGKSMVLNVHHGATLVNLTITGGKASGLAVAGGILSSGPLVLDHSTVSGNQGIDGGGIRGDTITLINSTVANNSVPSTFNVVGGVNFNLQGSLTLINSTVARNTGGTGIGPFGNGLHARSSSVTRSFPTTLSRTVCSDTSASPTKARTSLTTNRVGRMRLILVPIRCSARWLTTAGQRRRSLSIATPRDQCHRLQRYGRSALCSARHEVRHRCL
jgi:hypothetical protein